MIANTVHEPSSRQLLCVYWSYRRIFGLDSYLKTIWSPWQAERRVMWQTSSSNFYWKLSIWANWNIHSPSQYNFLIPCHATKLTRIVVETSSECLTPIGRKTFQTLWQRLPAGQWLRCTVPDLLQLNLHMYALDWIRFWAEPNQMSKGTVVGRTLCTKKLRGLETFKLRSPPLAGEINNSHNKFLLLFSQRHRITRIKAAKSWIFNTPPHVPSLRTNWFRFGCAASGVKSGVGRKSWNDMCVFYRSKLSLASSERSENRQNRGMARKATEKTPAIP